MTAFLFRNVDVFDGVSSTLKESRHVLIENGRIQTVSESEIDVERAEVIEGCGRVLMPGLIDAHYHCCLVNVEGFSFDTLPPSLLYPAASKLLTATLRRGFTTVRDAGGADYGLAEATKVGLILGPRIFISGRPLTQTGGHGEMRSKNQLSPCLCSSFNDHLVAVVDGEAEVRKAAREEFRKGADQLKIMLNGGVSTKGDPVWLCQFSDAEIRAAVEEAQRRRSYVMAHVYLDQQIRKAVELGVRSIEHGNFLEADTAQLMAEADAFLVPTLVTYKAIAEQGRSYGFSEENFRKLDEVMAAGLQSVRNAAVANIKIGFGTDLLGDMHVRQCEEFLIRSEVQTPFEILKSATSVNAELLGKCGELGVVAPGAVADLLLVDGNPLTDLSVFDATGSNLAVIMKDGEPVRGRE
jgi:imidazolonepropionase-like amidohydrolase